jgi:cytochrome c oxidase subunit 3
MDTSKDKTGIKIGMWLFLYSEIILFGGLFILYAVYFKTYTSDFVQGGRELDRMIGAFNTVILLASSFTVAASITAVRRQNARTASGFLIVSILCGIFFLVNKYFEWSHKFQADIYPGSEKLIDGPPGINIFFGMYYVITGLHGLHIVVGTVLLCISLYMVFKRKITETSYAVIENSGLYWHLVDLIWIFVFPLFYLVL